MISILYLIAYIILAALLFWALVWVFEYFVMPIPQKVKVGIGILVAIVVLIYILSRHPIPGL